MPELVRRTFVPVPPDALRAWHERPGALARLTPPWERVAQAREEGVAGGAEAELRVPVGPLRVKWVAKHEALPDGFRDEQTRGPFRRFEHEHRFLPAPGGSLLEDRVRYELPLGALGRAVAGRSVARRLERMFNHRHALTARDVTQMDAHPMTIAVSGASGFLGTGLVPLLTTQGHRVLTLVRHAPRTALQRRWDPEGETDPNALDGVDAVVHLAGVSIGKRWTPARKRAVMESRRLGTRSLAQAAARAGVPTFVSASAIGWYGDRGDDVVTEKDPRGEGFLADVVEAWEAASQPVADAGGRVVHARFGVVLSPRDGALQRLLLPFQMGVGGRVGSGRQWWSWVDYEDVLGALRHALREPAVRGPMLVASPNPVRNEEFVKTLGRVLRRPTVFPLPAAALRAAFGQMADELLLASCRAQPTVLQRTGYAFRFPDLEGSLRHLLGR